MMEDEELEDFIRLSREVMQQELQESCFDNKILNSRLVQVYMSKQPDMDAQKVLEDHYITVATLHKTYIRESNDVVKLPTRQMSPSQPKQQKLSGTSRMFRGASGFESESEMTEQVFSRTGQLFEGRLATHNKDGGW